MPEIKKCKNCSLGFEIANEDLVFYDKVSPVFGGKKYAIPAPSLCPDCRMQRRISWRNDRFMYQRKCSSCTRDIVSLFSEDKKVPVYCNKCWWGDGWDARKYGMDFDFSRPFFEQLKELLDKVPQLTIQNDDGVSSENCAYCQDFAFGKNCYFVIGTWHSRDSFYSSVNTSYNVDMCDCTHVQKSELIYMCMDSQNLFNCGFLQNSENCTDCFLGIDLKGCRDCFGCVGLRQKQFYIFNKPYSETDYKKKVAEYKTGSFENLEKIKDEFYRWSLQFPRKSNNMQNCENCEGNDLFNSRNTYGFSLRDAENCKFCHQGDINMFSYDIFSSGKPNWCYEGMTPDNSYQIHFTWFSWKNKYMFYTFNCHNSEYLFGCASLHRAKYCILNKQYTKEEYEVLVPKIIEHMKKNGEWGEYMDTKYSFFAYNETLAQEYFPLTKEQALNKDWQWKDPDKREYQKQTYEVADDIKNVPDEIVKEVLACTECGKNFKIIALELAYYRKKNLPIPRKCSFCRHKDRLKLRTPYKLFERKCAKCSAAIKTAYAPERKEIVYCEKCYLEAVY